MYTTLKAGGGGTLGLAVTYLGVSAATDTHRWELDLLLGIFIVVACCFVLYTLGVLVITVWRYFHAVEVLPSDLHCRYWPHEQRAEVSGAKVRIREWAGRVKTMAHAQFVKDEVKFEGSEFPDRSDGIYGPAFPQKQVAFAGDPKEGDPAWVVIRAEPQWPRGCAKERVLRAKIGITDHRPTPMAGTPEQVREAIARIDPLIAEAQAILELCGRPQEQMRGADPLHFQRVCIPRINQFARDASGTIHEVAPEYIGKLENIGNVFHETDAKPVMIQQVEKWLRNLGIIQDDLRRRL